MTSRIPGAVLGALLLTVACAGAPALAEPSAAPASPASPAADASPPPGGAAPPAEAVPAAGSLKPAAPTLGDAKAGNPPSQQPSTAAAAPVEPAAAPPPPPPPSLLVDIDLTRQRMTVTEHGNVKHAWAISSGREGYRTPTGTFRPTWMAKMWYSKQYDDAPMPHSVFFNGGIAVHATQSTGMLGRPASHGCIRLAPPNAAAFYALVSSHGKAMTRIKVHGTAKDATPVAARRQGTRAGERYGARALPRYAPSSRYFAPPRYSYNSYGGGYGAPGPQRYVYPGDPVPYGYRTQRPLYRPYGGSRYYYD